MSQPHDDEQRKRDPHAMASQEPPSVGSLPLSGGNPESRVDRLDQLLSLYERRCLEGKPPRDEEWQELCRQHPEDLDELRRQIALLQQADQFLKLPTVPHVQTDPYAILNSAVIPPESRTPTTIPGYEILGILGRGGMGVVYKARHTARRTVALKMILGGGSAGQSELARFRTEAESIARLQHPHIVQIHEVGEHKGLPYFSLEFCAGGSLDKRLAGTPLPALQAATLVEQLARAMQAAHDKGVIHRDLKPANVLLTEDGIPKITDFGLAKNLDEVGKTQSGAIMGTPSYMAPEQAAGKSKELGPACDIYALGALLYECLTGRPPFRAATPLDTLLQVMKNEPPPPTQLQPKTPRDLETICLKCLRKEPGKRYAQAANLAEDLRRFQAGEPIQARPVGRSERLWRWCRRNPAVSGLVAALLLALASGFLGVLWKWYEADSLRRDADSLRRDAQRTAAKIFRDRGLALAQQGDIGRGLLYLTRALQQSEHIDDDALSRLIRADLSGWQNHLHRLQQVLKQDGPIQVVTLSHDGRFALIAGDAFATRIWNLESGQPLGRELPCAAAVAAAAFAPDGKTLLVGYKGKPNLARLWEVATGKVVRDFPHPEDLLAVAISPDGALLLTGSMDQKARLWQAATGKLVGKPLEHTQGVHIVAFSPDGKWALTGSTDRTVRLLDTANGKSVGEPLRHKGEVTGAVFVGGGRQVLTSSRDGFLRLWERQTRTLLRESPKQFLGVQALAVSPNPSVPLAAALDGDGRVSFWSLKDLEPKGVLLLEKGGATALAFSPDGRTLLTRDLDSDAQLWDVSTRRPFGQPLAHQQRVAAAVFVPASQKVLTASWDGTARLWELSPGARPLQILRHPDAAAVAFSPDGSLLATGGGGELRPNLITWGEARLWDAATGSRRATLLHDHAVGAIAFSPTSPLLLTGGDDGLARFWNIATGKPDGQAILLAERSEPIRTVAFSPDGSLVATGGFDGAAQLWQTATRKHLAGPLRHDDRVRVAVFSSDGKTLATGGDDSRIRFWNTTNGATARAPLKHSDHVLALAFSPDGRWLLSGGRDGTAILWEVATGKPVGAPMRHKAGKAVRGVAFGPRGQMVATAGADNRVRFWLAPTCRPVGPELYHPAALHAVAWSAAGDRLLTACKDDACYLWQMPQPLQGDAREVTRQVEVMTGLELDADESPRVLDADAWQLRKQRAAAVERQR